MRKTKHWLMTIAALLCSVIVNAYNFEVNGIYYNITSSVDKAVEVTYYVTSGTYSGALVIPSRVTYNGVTYNVTSIGDKACISSKLLTSVSIPNSVTSIGKEAFSGCTELASITFSEGLISIGNNAFSHCKGLTSITIPEGVTTIGYCAFWDCTSLTSVIIPASVTEINSSFDSCSGLTSITCKASTPPTVTDSYTFYGVNRSIPVYVPSSSISAYQSAQYWKTFTNFLPCYIASGICGDNLTWKLLENGELLIEGEGEMTNLTSATNPWYNDYRNDIKKITISNGVTSIGNNAFSGFGIESVIIPESVTSIGVDAFSLCKNLISINLPKGVVNIGGGAFSECKSLSSIIIPEGVTEIQEKTFYSCSNLTSITLPESVTSIGSCAFNSCTNLTSITIPNRITEISEGLFAYCTSLENITIPNSVTSIGGQAFYCSGLKSIKIPASVTNIGYFAFEYCENLTSIEIPNSITTLEGGVFAYCSNLKEVSIPNSVTILGPYNSGMEGPFEACTSLKSVNIPESVTIIGECAFNLCTGLTSIYCEATLPPTCGGLAFSEVDKSIPVYVPSSSVSAYQSAAGWNEFKNIRSMPGSITINQYGSGTYCSEYALDFSEVEGLKAYAATGFNTETGIVTLTRVMTSKPGIGLFIKGEPGEYVVPTLEKTNDNSLNMLVGTLEDVTVGKLSSGYANYKYTIKAGDVDPMFHNFDDGFALSAGKAYLQIPVEWLPTMEARSIGIRFDDGDGATDIDNAEIRNQKSEIVYDLMGRRVASPKKGELYIIDGKKVIY